MPVCARAVLSLLYTLIVVNVRRGALKHEQHQEGVPIRDIVGYDSLIRLKTRNTVQLDHLDLKSALICIRRRLDENVDVPGELAAQQEYPLYNGTLLRRSTDVVRAGFLSAAPMHARTQAISALPHKPNTHAMGVRLSPGLQRGYRYVLPGNPVSILHGGGCWQ